MEYGVKHKSDDLWMDWFDFTLEYANTDYNHLIEGLPITISDGILKAYPDHSIYKDIIIPPTIHTIDFYLDDCTGYTLYLPASVKYIGSYCFPYSVLDAVYYEGTLGQFKNIYIDNWGNNGIFSSDIYYSSYTPSPVITDHPKHEPYTLTNTPFTLSVSAVFTSEEPSYQWYRNTVFSNAGGTPIEGATEVTVEITEEDQGKYYYYAVVGSVSPAASIPVEIMAFDDELPTYMEKYSPDINCYVFEESDRVLFYGNGSLDYDIWLGSNMAFEFSEGITSITDEFLNEVQYYVAQYIVSPANPVYTTDSCGALIRKSDNTLLSFPGRSNISEYSIPQGIAHVAANAFEWADFDVLHIPGSLLSLSKGIGFPHLDTITVAEDNPNFYYDEYGALICSYDQTLIRYSGNWDFYEYPVPDGIVNIADNAFMYAFPLQHITFPETVEYIGDYAFWNCDWLESVTIPKSVTHIGPFAFYACYDLADIYFLGAAPEANASFEEYTTLHCFDSYPGWTDSAAYDPESGTWNDCPILVTIENILGVSTLSENDVFSAEADNMAQGSFIAVSAYDSHGKMLSYTQAAVYDTGNVYTAIAIPENTFEIRVYAFDSSYCPLQKVLFRRP